MTTDEQIPSVALSDASQVPDSAYDAAIVARAQNLLFTMPERIERYRILDRIGGGGMGEVFMSEQDPPVRRIVALKVIRAGMDTFRVVARFDAERQALAMMNHPNIAAVYDAGATDTGRPYFVMEWVPGIPITRYCDEKKLTVRQRLELMIPVCQAIRHAHQKGIIHRDIKPHNVLVGLTDGIPKVIDFGIAKAIGVPQDERAIQTETAQWLGTPQYMAPEQFDSTGQQIDTRTDVYGLGVLLYELLTGKTPLASAHGPGRSYELLAREVRETDPPKPSARLRAQPPALATAAANRSVTPALLRQQVRGDLDLIVMKALEKDPSRRYESVAELSDDLGRLLRGERIIAGTSGGMYRLRKFVLRHKLVIALVTAIFASLLLGIAVTTVELFRANRLQKLAEAGRAEAEKERKNAQSVVDFLDNDFLAKANAGAIPDPAVRDSLVHTLIEPAMRSVDDRLKDQPLARAAVRQTFAEVLWSLGRYDLSLEQARAAFDIRTVLLGQDDPLTGRSNHSVAWALLRLGRYSEAGSLFKRWLDRCQRLDPPDSQPVLDAMEDYATFLMTSGKPADAVPIFARVYEQTCRTHGKESPAAIQILRNYAGALFYAGQHETAERLGKQVLDQARQILGERNPTTLQATDDYAMTLMTLNRLPEAEQLRKQSWNLRVATLGPDFPDTIRAESEYAMSVADLDKAAEAKPLAKTAYEHARRVLGADNAVTLKALNNFVTVLTFLDQNQEAEPFAKEAFQRLRSEFGDDFQETIYAESNYGIVVYGLQKPAEAVPLFQHVWEYHRKTLGDDNPETQRTRGNLAAALRESGRAADAAKLPGGPTTAASHSSSTVPP